MPVIWNAPAILLRWTLSIPQRSFRNKLLQADFAVIIRLYVYGYFYNFLCRKTPPNIPHFELKFCCFMLYFYVFKSVGLMIWCPLGDWLIGIQKFPIYSPLWWNIPHKWPVFEKSHLNLSNAITFKVEVKWENKSIFWVENIRGIIPAPGGIFFIISIFLYFTQFFNWKSAATRCFTSNYRFFRHNTPDGIVPGYGSMVKFCYLFSCVKLSGTNREQEYLASVINARIIDPCRDGAKVYGCDVNPASFQKHITELNSDVVVAFACTAIGLMLEAVFMKSTIKAFTSVLGVICSRLAAAYGAGAACAAAEQVEKEKKTYAGSVFSYFSSTGLYQASLVIFSKVIFLVYSSPAR